MRQKFIYLPTVLALLKPSSRLMGYGWLLYKLNILTPFPEAILSSCCSAGWSSQIWKQLSTVECFFFSYWEGSSAASNSLNNFNYWGWILQVRPKCLVLTATGLDPKNLENSFNNVDSSRESLRKKLTQHVCVWWQDFIGTHVLVHISDNMLARWPRTNSGPKWLFKNLWF